jgi:hypothetical protein
MTFGKALDTLLEPVSEDDMKARSFGNESTIDLVNKLIEKRRNV